jgi:hypothetical protein
MLGLNYTICVYLSLNVLFRMKPAFAVTSMQLVQKDLHYIVEGTNGEVLGLGENQADSELDKPPYCRDGRMSGSSYPTNAGSGDSPLRVSVPYQSGAHFSVVRDLPQKGKRYPSPGCDIRARFGSVGHRHLSP